MIRIPDEVFEAAQLAGIQLSGMKESHSMKNEL